MESLDFVIDLTENLEKQNIDYFLIALRKNKVGSKADVFYRMSDRRSVTDMCHVLDTLKDDIETESGESHKGSFPSECIEGKQNDKKPSKQRAKAKREKPKQTKKPRRKRGRPKKDDNK